MEQGYILGFVLFFTVILGVLSFYLVVRLLAYKVHDNYWRTRFYEIQESEKNAKKNWYKYSELVNDEYNRTKVIPKGFERCPNPKMIAPIKDV